MVNYPQAKDLWALRHYYNKIKKNINIIQIVMGLIQPKPFLNKIRTRHHAFGIERRRNLSKIVLEHGTPFPLSIEYEDIDKAMFDWVDKKLDISYNGKKLPTYKMFSNQKISEYMQTWDNTDAEGNIVMNFKTLTRENNPQHGENQGQIYNVPGDRFYPMFYVPVLQKNGEEAYDVYSMKQPLAVDFNYTINIIVDKYELLNRFNEMINAEFAGLESYISPNGHPMPMLLSSINDESEYAIDDRKFYSQTYIVKLMGYIIRKQDYKVEKVPSRFIMRFIDNGIAVHKGKRQLKYDLPYEKTIASTATDNCADDSVDTLPTYPHAVLHVSDKPTDDCFITDDSPFYYKPLEYDIIFPVCESTAITVSFESNMVLDSVDMENIYDDRIIKDDKVLISGTEILDEKKDGIIFSKGDKVIFKITKEDIYAESKIILKGHDPNTVYDSRENPENQFDIKNVEDKVIIDGENKGNN